MAFGISLMLLFDINNGRNHKTIDFVDFRLEHIFGNYILHSHTAILDSRQCALLDIAYFWNLKKTISKSERTAAKQLPFEYLNIHFFSYLFRKTIIVYM